MSKREEDQSSADAARKMVVVQEESRAEEEDQEWEHGVTTDRVQEILELKVDIFEIKKMVKVAEVRRGSIGEDWMARARGGKEEQNKAESESLGEDSSKILEELSSNSSEKKNKPRAHKSDKQDGAAIFEEVRELFCNENKVSRLGLSEDDITFIINSTIKHLKVEFLQTYLKEECKDGFFAFLLQIHQRMTQLLERRLDCIQNRELYQLNEAEIKHKLDINLFEDFYQEYEKNEKAKADATKLARESTIPVFEEDNLMHQAGELPEECLSNEVVDPTERGRESSQGSPRAAVSESSQSSKKQEQERGASTIETSPESRTRQDFTFMFKNRSQAQEVFGYATKDVLSILQTQVKEAGTASMAGSMLDRYLRGKDTTFVAGKMKKSLAGSLQRQIT